MKLVINEWTAKLHLLIEQDPTYIKWCDIGAENVVDCFGTFIPLRR